MNFDSTQLGLRSGATNQERGPLCADLAAALLVTKSHTRLLQWLHCAYCEVSGAEWRM